MHIKLLRIVIAACKMRIYEGDHPTTPAFSVEVLESAIFDLSDRVVDLRTTLDTAEQKLASVEQLLMASNCPNCDGSGSWVREGPRGEIIQEQCQWCFKRSALKPTESAAPQDGNGSLNPMPPNADPSAGKLDSEPADAADPLSLCPFSQG